MNQQELDVLIRGAIRVTSIVVDELEVMFGIIDKLSATDDPPTWTPTGRTYARLEAKGKGARPRALPQALYRIYVPAASAAGSHEDRSADDDDRVHLRVDKKTRILVIASCLYSIQEPDKPPQIICCTLQNLVFPTWGATKGPPAGLRRTHLRQLIETLDLAAGNESKLRIDSLTVGPRQKLGCEVECILREPLTSIADGKALENVWRRVTAAVAPRPATQRRAKAERSLHV